MKHAAFGSLAIAGSLILFSIETSRAQDDEIPPYGDWLVEEIRGTAVPEDMHSTFSLSEEGRASGSGACNRYIADAELAGETLTFGPIASTRMLCSAEEMQQEERFLDALGGVTRWRRFDDNLVLLDEAGDTLVRMTPFKSEVLLTIPVPTPEGSTVQSRSVTYQCGDQSVDVEYMMAGPVSLAVLDFADDFVVAVRVISASGAKYAGEHYTWWSKGDEAMLEDLTQDQETQPRICTAQE